MKKWIYLIIPGILLTVFLVFYFSHQKEATAREEARSTALAKKIADEKALKEKAEQQAREDAAKKQAEREAEEKKKEDERRAKQAAADKQIRDETNQARAEADKAHKELQQLEIALDKLRKDKDRLTREAFDLAKQVELAKVARRNAELESQRMVEMISRRAADSSLVRPPMIPAAPAPRS